MAYAKLKFLATATVQQKLKEIVKVCTGVTTSPSQLEFAIQQESEVVSIEPAGWTLADPDPLDPNSSTIEVGGTATKNEYRLQSPCVNTNKIKYCALEMYSTKSPNIANYTTIANTRPAAGSTTGFLWVPIGSGVSSNVLQNARLSARFIRNQHFNSSTVSVHNCIRMSASEIFISVTNRKLIIYYYIGVNDNAIILNLEFPETISTVSTNNIPFIHVSIGIAFTAANQNTYLDDNGTIWGADINDAKNFYKGAFFINWFSQQTRLRSNTNADVNGSMPYYLPTLPSPSVSSSGDPIFPLVPIIDVRTTIGEGIHDYSALTNLYHTYKTSNYIMSGDEFSYLGITYVFLTVHNNRVIAIKKA